MQLSNNTISITVGTSSSSLGFVEKLMEVDCKVIICGKRENRLHDLCSKHPNLITKNYNISVATGREELSGWVLQNCPETNVLINNNSVQPDLDMTTPANLNRVYTKIETNPVAAIILTSFLPSI